MWLKSKSERVVFNLARVNCFKISGNYIGDNDTEVFEVKAVFDDSSQTIKTFQSLEEADKCLDKLMDKANSINSVQFLTALTEIKRAILDVSAAIDCK